MTGSNTTCRFNNHIAVVIHDIEGSRFTTQAGRDQLKHHAIFGDTVLVVIVEGFQDILSAVTQCTQQNRRWQFTTTVDTYIYEIFWIKLEIEP